MGADTVFMTGAKISAVPIRIDECHLGFSMDSVKTISVTKIANTEADVLLIDKKPKTDIERVIDFECDLRFTRAYFYIFLIKQHQKITLQDVVY
jgi:hypothetical protein